MKSKLLLLFIACIEAFTGHAQWFEITSPYFGNVHVIVFKNATEGFIGTNTSILKTTDGGESWISVTSSDFYITTIDFPGSMVGYYGANNNVIRKTTDGGSTWTLQNPNLSPFGISGISMINESTGTAVGGAGNIRATVSGGSTWSSVASGTSENLKGIKFIDATTGIIIGEGGKILRSTNGGGSWSSVSSGTSSTLYDLFFVDATTGFIVGASGKILKTTNGGASWSLLTSGTTTYLYSVCFKDAMNGYIGGDNGLLLKTTDGGSTWTPVTSGIFTEIYDITYNSPRYIAIAYGGDIFTDVSFTGIETADAESKVNLFPNPFSDFAHLDLSELKWSTNEIELRITDIAGDLIQQQTISVNDQTEIGSELSGGYYFIELKDDEHHKVIPAIKRN